MFHVPFVRQEIEALIELLESHPRTMIHDRPASEVAAELRLLIGVSARAPEDLRAKNSQ